MNRPHGNRARLGGMLLAAVAALAMLALPGIAASHDRGHDHAGDAGTIQSFDPETGILVVDLADGGSISGLVVSHSKIRCDHGRHHGHRHGLLEPRRGAKASHRGGHEDEDEDNHSGPGRDHEAGEDPPGHDGTPPGKSEGPGKGAEHSHRCTTDDLVAGATVEVAELVLIDGKAYFRLVVIDDEDETTSV